MSESHHSGDGLLIPSKGSSCHHFECTILNSDDVLRYYLLISYLLRTEKKEFLSYLRVNNVNMTEDLHICIHCQYCDNYVTIKDHQYTFHHPFTIRVSDFHLFCLWCNQIVKNTQLSFYNSLLENPSMLPLIPKVLREVDLRLFSTPFVGSGFHQYHRIIRSDYIGLKGMKNLGFTNSFNCVLQLFLHLPFIYSFFLSYHHSTIECFLTRGTNEDTFVHCLYCCLFHLLNELFADNNDSFVIPHTVLVYFWNNFNALRSETEFSVQQWLFIFLRSLCFLPNLENETSYFQALFSERLSNPSNQHEGNLGDRTCTLYYTVKAGISFVNIQSLCNDFQNMLITKQWTSFQDSSALASDRQIIDLPTILVLSVDYCDDVQFPIKGLTIAPNPTKSIVYDLYGIICDQSYHCEKNYCIMFLNQKWYQFCDEIVYEIAESLIPSYKPCILVYVKRYVKG